MIPSPLESRKSQKEEGESPVAGRLPLHLRIVGPRSSRADPGDPAFGADQDQTLLISLRASCGFWFAWARVAMLAWVRMLFFTSSVVASAISVSRIRALALSKFSR